MSSLMYAIVELIVLHCDHIQNPWTYKTESDPTSIHTLADL